MSQKTSGGNVRRGNPGISGRNVIHWSRYRCMDHNEWSAADTVIPDGCMPACSRPRRRLSSAALAPFSITRWIDGMDGSAIIICTCCNCWRLSVVTVGVSQWDVYSTLHGISLVSATHPANWRTTLHLYAITDHLCNNQRSQYGLNVLRPAKLLSVFVHCVVIASRQRFWRDRGYQLHGRCCARYDAVSIFMKLFKTANILTVRECQKNFVFELPSVILDKRCSKI